LKPFDEDRLRASIERARERLASRSATDFAEQLHGLLQSEKALHPERLVVRNGERYEFVPVASIDWIESANNYVQLHCGPKSWLAAETLTGLEARLDRKTFLRVHRRHIVNVSRIVAAHSMFNGTYELEIANGVRVSTGRQYKDAVQALIEK
jgi:two-component system LytT family response regulator